MISALRTESFSPNDSEDQGSEVQRLRFKFLYHGCIEDHFEQMETVWLPARKNLQLGEDERYQSLFGFWRPDVNGVI